MPIDTLRVQTSQPRRPLTPLDAATLTCWVTVGLLVAWSASTDSAVALLAVVCGGLLFVTFWDRPKLAFVTWILSLVMVPVWIGVNLVTMVDFNCLVAIAAVVATLSRARPKITKFDVYLTMVLVVSFAAVLFADSPVALWRQILLRWFIPFFAARVLVSATGARFAVNVIAVIFGLIGALAVVELLISWHPFAGWDNGSSEFEVWHAIQTRDGQDRSEWAFGHSIALGGSLALSIPFIARSTYNRLFRAALLLCVVAGIISTASRSSLLAAGLTAAVCILYVLKDRSARVAALAITVIITLLAGSYLATALQTWARGGSSEEQSSFDYRGQLYSTYVPAIEWLGKSPMYITSGSGYHSTDSAFLAIGLRFGWIILFTLVLPLALSVIRLLIGRATLAEVAIVGQLPLFFTTALVTQYESIVFLVVGIAVQMIIERTNSAEQLFKPESTSSCQRQSESSVGGVRAHRDDRRGSDGGADRAVLAAGFPVDRTPRLGP